MGRSPSPILSRELANLEKDVDSRKSAMKTLKSYVKDLDPKEIPLFVAQVSEANETSLASGEYTISLFEVLARVHGPKVTPQIDKIMSTIVRTLKSSGGLFSLHQSCSKVVPALARYGIDATMADDEKANVIHSLSNPLCDILMGPSENSASGAALCLKALVESDGWRFASNEVVDDICLRVTGALEEERTQTNAHMGLVMALAKHSSLTIEAFARSLVRSGLQMLTAGKWSSQKRLSAIQMINFLMKCVDSRSIFSELPTIIYVMEKCHKDRMPFIRGAAFEALQTARTLAAENGPKIMMISSPTRGLNFSRRADSGRTRSYYHDSGDRSGAISPRSLSPESRTIGSFDGFDSITESSLLIEQASDSFDYDRSRGQGLWKYESGSIDLSLNDDLYLEEDSAFSCSKYNFDHFEGRETNDTGRDCSEVLTDFVSGGPTRVKSQSCNSNSQTLQSELITDDTEISMTPVKSSLQDVDSCDLNSSMKQQNISSILFESEVHGSLPKHIVGDEVCQNFRNAVEDKTLEGVSEASWQDDVTEANQIEDDSELMSPMLNVPMNPSLFVLDEVGQKESAANETVKQKMRSCSKASLTLVCGLALIVPAVMLSLMWLDNNDEQFQLVPT